MGKCFSAEHVAALHSIRRLPSVGQPDDTIVCGHSFGHVVARHVSLQVERCGLHLRCLASIDYWIVSGFYGKIKAEGLRHAALTNKMLYPVIFHLHNLDAGFCSVRLPVCLFDFMCQALANIFDRDDVQHERRALYTSTSVFVMFPDTDHRTVAVDHAWDMCRMLRMFKDAN